MARRAYLGVVDLARKGRFSVFDAEAYLASGAMEAMERIVREGPRAWHRNALLTSIAPWPRSLLYAERVSGIWSRCCLCYTAACLRREGVVCVVCPPRRAERGRDLREMWRDEGCTVPSIS